MAIKYFVFILLAISSIVCHSQDAKVIHAFVALCDNENQGIVKVPAKIGNGKDPFNNLYWGCQFGTKNIFKTHPEWKLIKTIKNVDADILERCVFKHKTKNIFLIADAWDGAAIKKTTIEFLNAASGKTNNYIHVDSLKIPSNGNANLICYVGHNGLMDFTLENYSEKTDDKKRDVIIIACASKQYFKEAILKSGANPLIWSTHLMSAESYTLEAAIAGWLKNETPAQIRIRAAEAYNKYQKCGLKGAMNLIVTGY